MWTYHPELLAQPVPRYTSFPTAAEFGDDVGPADLGAALALIGADEPISLYLHIPYCQEICWYCGCNTGAANRTARVSAYVRRLEEEIDLVAARLAGRGRLSRIAFGGGSPNAISPAQFAAIMARLRAAFHWRSADISVELDPRGFDARWSELFAREGVSRVSLGVQSFAPRIQAEIGRIQPAGLIMRAVSQLRAAGVGSINFDLMYGLPGQTDRDLDDTLATTLAMAPERLAVFGYAHVPHLIPRQRRIDASALPDAASRFRQAERAYRKLTASGYVPAGFDHFALPDDALATATREGRLRRNFQGFTEDQADVLIGLGASAISSFPSALLQNEKNSGRYHMRIGHGQFATARGWRRSAADRMRGAAIEKLLCRGATDLTAFPDLPAIREQLAPFEAHGLIGWAGSVLVLAPDSIPYARSIAAALDPYRRTSPTRFSSAV